MKGADNVAHRGALSITPLGFANQVTVARSVSTIATAFVVALPQVGHAQNVTPPPVPGTLHVPEGNEAFLIGHAFGSQDYVCAASGSGVAFVLTTPEAVLFDNPARRVVNHFFSPNPVEGGTIRATCALTS
jgi:hypothetical protein